MYNGSNSYFQNPTAAPQFNQFQWQQPQSQYFSQRFMSIPGRTINDPGEVTPQEVPMDGSVSLFPKNDYSCIYAKTWNKDGTIATIRFIPEPINAEPMKTDSYDDILTKIDSRLSSIEKKLSYRKHHQNDQKSKKQSYEKQNYEVTDDE